MPTGIIIFDGYCNLCNFIVDFMIKRDRARRFVYVANQSEAGQILLSSLNEDPQNVETFFLYQNEILSKRSTAALRVIQQLPFPWLLASIGWIFPRFIRDAMYSWIAKNRYRFFGKKDSCRLPSEEELGLLIESREHLERILTSPLPESRVG